ncbi:hypothetical protein jhhlp_001765 [Lomentospora prolificans]|uniref:DUF676 domain-containing protein n=1 Tax=Lomentospora prolificans TaxID=41688 RepID=A0A2N3NGR0_9PEZI|nr:hypothetical protein jhhlp_001765 [Lomentospora prolificans]
MEKRLCLQELYHPPKRTALQHSNNQATWNGTNRPLSLVLVDGLDGDPVQTWTHKATDVCWPKDLMPAVRPRTIVLSFGYNGDMYRNNSVLGIRDNARWLLSALCDHRSDMATLRPVIFVGHCLGGLIVKQAMCFANREKHYHSVASATIGIIFFGTPVFKTDQAQMKALAKSFQPLDKAKKRRIWDWGTLSPLVQAIIDGADDLAEISEDFLSYTDKYSITIYYEGCAWPGTRNCIVDKSRASMEIESAMHCVDADHIGMCQFKDKEDSTFIHLCNCIADVAGADTQVREAAEVFWQSAPHELRSQYFVARMEVLYPVAESRDGVPRSIEGIGGDERWSESTRVVEEIEESVRSRT